MRYRIRICQPQLTYHVFSRCIEGSYLLQPKTVKNMLIDVIQQAQEKYSFELSNYVIMDNHFHFVIKTVNETDSISRIMQYIKSIFAKRYNQLMKRTGPVWNERFKDRIIEQSKNPLLYFLTLMWYIACNPVRKEMVTDPRNYRYCSIKAYLDKGYKSPVKITLHQYFQNLGRYFEERVSAFLWFEKMYIINL